MTPVPFHPLADLFPLIEGKDFDDLVQSIKENGQIEPIVTLGGTILDGRNRYRACLKAQVEPRIEEFSGADPARFVICKNIQRRHLNVRQRALLATHFCSLSRGQHPSSGFTQMKQEDAAKLFDVAPSTITAAKIVLERGTDEEKQLAREGSIPLESTSRAIRGGTSPEERKTQRDKPKDTNTRRVETQQMQAEIWRRLRDALEALTGLPLPTEVAAIAFVQDKKTKGAAIDRRLIPALDWLMEFSDAWNARNGQS